tara:strand:- start:3497 stop:5311 length:1815 start_codon:yes stop_codon:yes gene_type:complete
MQIINKILYLLSAQEIKRAILLLLMIIIMAFLEMMGIASVMPFMSVVSNPDIIETNVNLNKIFRLSNKFGIQDEEQFVFVLGVFVFLFLVISLSFKALTTYAQTRFVQMRQHTISKKVLENFLRQPYSWFLNRNSADLEKSILSEVGTIVGRGLKSLFELISRVIVSIAIIVLLFLVDAKIALIVGVTTGGFFGLIYFFTNNYLYRIGKERFKNNKLRFMSLSETFGATKEIKVGGLEKTFIDRFSIASEIFARKSAYVGILSQLPRYFLEMIAFGGVILMILYLMIDRGGINSALPVLSVYVFAGYRLMPSFQQIYASFNQLTFVSPSLNSLYKDLKDLEEPNIKKDGNKIIINKSICLKNIYYNYPNSSDSTLRNVNINIPAKTTIGLMGSTGSGKTTTVDIILGLLEAQKGTLEVDGQIISKKNSRVWQNSIGYVPQHIYLADDSVAANIAFGTISKDINYDSVEKASKIANLHDFVTNELPNKYQTKVGERGIRLSGGQRQRIGIARALYHNPSVIILDEATSALDNDTEKLVMNAIEKLGQDKTIILIAHRLSTLKNCDKIFLMEKGEMKREMTYKELNETEFNLQQNLNDKSKLKFIN